MNEINADEFLKDACEEGRAWAMQFSSLAEAWDNCPRADWMLWALEEMAKLPKDKPLRRFACWCVRNTPLADGRKVFDVVTDERSRRMVEVAEQYADGIASKEDLLAACAAARISVCDQAADMVCKLVHSAWGMIYNVIYDCVSIAAAYAPPMTEDNAMALARSAQANRLREIVPNPFREEMDDEQNN